MSKKYVTENGYEITITHIDSSGWITGYYASGSGNTFAGCWNDVGKSLVDGNCNIIEVNPEPKSVMELQRDDMYYMIYIDGTVCSKTWQDYPPEQHAREQGNVFLTWEEAIRERDYRIALTKVKLRIKELNGVWKPVSGEEIVYAICWDYGANTFRVWSFSSVTYIDRNLYLKSSDLGHKLINELEPELKLILGVN